MHTSKETGKKLAIVVEKIEHQNELVGGCIFDDYDKTVV
jgi:hypothetical protein